MPVGFAATDAQLKPIEKLMVTRGLEGQDDNIDLLQSFFKEMQKATVETLSPDDLLSFASCAHYFGVISIETSAPPTTTDEVGDEDAEGEPEDETEAVSESAYPASSRAASPPPSSVATNFSIISPSDEDEEISEDEIYSRYAALSEQEKVLKWREAFLDKLEEDEEPILPPTRPEDFYEPPVEDDQSMSDAQAIDNTEHFINWPEDVPAGEDHTQTAEGVDDSPSIDALAGLQFYTPMEPVLVDKEFGREYLEPEQYDTPAPEPPKIPTIPEMDAFIYEEALKYRDRLRALRVAEYERKQARRAREGASRPLPPPAPLPVPGTTTCIKPIGLIYLWTSQTFNDPLHMGECSLGFYFAPDYRKKEYLVEALNKAVAEAFYDRQCHRLQAIVVENEEKLYSLELLTASGFRHEGTRRRAFYSSIAQEWKDVTYFAMLATEWVYDNSDTSSSVRLRTTSLWDEILTRHQRELDELHRLQEKTLKRSNSTETIRQMADDAAPRVFDFSDAETQSTAGTEISASSVSSSPKRRKISSENVGPSEMQPRSSHRYPPGGAGDISHASAQPFQASPAFSPSRPRQNQPQAGPSTRRRRTGGLSFSSSSASSSTSGSGDWVMLDD